MVNIPQNPRVRICFYQFSFLEKKCRYKNYSYLKWSESWKKNFKITRRYLTCIFVIRCNIKIYKMIFSYQPNCLCPWLSHLYFLPSAAVKRTQYVWAVVVCHRNEQKKKTTTFYSCIFSFFLFFSCNRDCNFCEWDPPFIWVNGHLWWDVNK